VEVGLTQWTRAATKLELRMTDGNLPIKIVVSNAVSELGYQAVLLGESAFTIVYEKNKMTGLEVQRVEVNPKQIVILK